MPPRRRKRLPPAFPPITIEREYAKWLLRLIEAIRVQISGLNISEWVQGARQDAGEGKKARKGFNSIRDSLGPEAGLENLARQFARKTSTFQRRQLNRQVRAGLGVDLIGSEEGIAGLVEGFTQENVSLIRGMETDYITRVEQTVTRALQEGTRLRLVQEEIASVTGVTKNRARLIARDQIGKLHGQVNAKRQQNIGIKKFVWQDSNDRRVRPEHRARDGVTYSYARPPNGELPGTPIQCRCYAEPVFDDLLGP